MDTAIERATQWILQRRPGDVTAEENQDIEDSTEASLCRLDVIHEPKIGKSDQDHRRETQ